MMSDDLDADAGGIDVKLCCANCWFYCHSGLFTHHCNVDFLPHDPSDSCDRFAGNVADSFITSLEDYITAKAAQNLNSEKSAKKRDAPMRCISCGEKLEMQTRGRNKYCRKCGCFLPECIYDQRFTDLVKDQNPMKIIKPPPLPTAVCKG